MLDPPLPGLDVPHRLAGARRTSTSTPRRRPAPSTGASGRSSATGRTRSCGSRCTGSTPGSSTGCGSAGCCSRATRAHLVSPFGARGLNSGVADAENAAWKIALRRLRLGARGAAGELPRRAARRGAWRTSTVTTATMDFLVPPDAERAAHRADVLARAADDPAARAHVDSGRLAEPFWYVDSPLTTPDPTRPFGGRPPRGAVPPRRPRRAASPTSPCTASLHRDGESPFRHGGSACAAARARPGRLPRAARRRRRPAAADAAATGRRRAGAGRRRSTPPSPPRSAPVPARPGSCARTRTSPPSSRPPISRPALCRALAPSRGHPDGHPTEGARPMAYYRRSATSRRSGTPSTATPDGAPLPRGADGGGGLLLRLLAALPPRRPVGDRRRQVVGAARPGHRRRTTR